MYYSRLSVLQKFLNDEDVSKIDQYFYSLIGDAKNNITISKLSTATGLSTHISTKVLTCCKENGILKVSYCIKCPECGMIIMNCSSLSNIPNTPTYCYNCEEEIEATPECIEVFYSLNDEDDFFTIGQQITTERLSKFVAPENSLDNILKTGNVNKYLFEPTDKEYNDLLNRIESINNINYKNKKEQGDSLEKIVIELFNMCSVFEAAGIKTSLNQIDCLVRNKMFIPYGILGQIGLHFIIECKNEKRAPSGSYISKLHSIITEANASNSGTIKFGIIVSKVKAPTTYKQHAIHYYLSQKLIIIAICLEEIKELAETKGNLLELLERKISEITLNATTDLKEIGLYES